VFHKEKLAVGEVLPSLTNQNKFAKNRKSTEDIEEDVELLLSVVSTLHVKLKEDQNGQLLETSLQQNTSKIVCSKDMVDTKKENSVKDSTENAMVQLVNFVSNNKDGLVLFTLENQWENASGNVLTRRTVVTFHTVVLGSSDVLENVKDHMHLKTVNVNQCQKELSNLEKKPNVHGEDTERNTEDNVVVQHLIEEFIIQNHFMFVAGEEKLMLSKKLTTEEEKFAQNINAVNNFQNVLVEDAQLSEMKDVHLTQKDNQETTVTHMEIHGLDHLKKKVIVLLWLVIITLFLQNTSLVTKDQFNGKVV